MTDQMPGTPQFGDPLNGPKPMSLALREVLDKGIGDAMQEAGGGYVTGSIAFVSFIDPDGDACWSISTPDGQSSFVTLGLLRSVTLMVEERVKRGMLA